MAVRPVSHRGGERVSEHPQPGGLADAPGPSQIGKQWPHRAAAHPRPSHGVSEKPPEPPGARKVCQIGGMAPEDRVTAISGEVAVAAERAEQVEFGDRPRNGDGGRCRLIRRGQQPEPAVRGMLGRKREQVVDDARIPAGCFQRVGEVSASLHSGGMHRDCLNPFPLADEFGRQQRQQGRVEAPGAVGG